MILRLLLRLSCVLCVTGWACTQAWADDRSPGLLQFHHTAWTTRDGAPGPVLALAQTPDGRLWLGTPTGLFTYDGNEFTRMDTLGGTPLPASAIRSLAVDRGGALWIGYLFGGASRFAEGRLTNYGAEQGLPKSGTLARFAFGPDGTVWAAAIRGLYRLEGGQWISAFPTLQIVVDVFVDSASRVWIVSKEVLYLHDPQAPQGAPRRIADAPWDDSFHMTEAPDGSLWVVDRTNGVRRFGPEGPRPLSASVPKGMAPPLMFDRQSMAWYMGRGLWRSDPTAWMRPGEAAAPTAPAWFGRQEGLSGEVAYAMLQDREGTVWIGTSGGLDRFRRNKLHRVSVEQDSQAVALAPGPGSSVWIGRGRRPLLRLGDAAREFPQITDVWTVYQDAEGSLWAGTFRGHIWRIQGDEATEVPPPEATGFGRPVQALTRDHLGRLWIARSGIYRLEDGRWQDMSGKDGLPQDHPTQMHTDPQGRVWFGFTGPRLALYEGERARVFTRSDGLDVGTVLALHGTSGHLWIGGESGLAVRVGGRFSPLVGAGGVGFHTVSGVVETASGELWLNSAEGVVRVPAPEVKRFLADPTHRPTFELLDHRDGLEGRVTPIGASPPLIAARDGRLWIATSTSVASIDPAAIARNPVPPPVWILSLKTGDTIQTGSDAMELPALTASLQIQYTGHSLALPERVQFRYRLDRVDSQWQEAGARRTAYYTNLGPGAYRFEVLAANEDGVWSEQPATLRFSIAPAFYQTAAFRYACAVLVLFILGWLYVLRVRILTARAAEKMRERQFERERIAVELHDTLLQGVYGLLLQIEAVMSRLKDEPARQDLARAAENAERLVDEGRDRLAGLRSSAPPDPDLATALPRLALETVHGTKPEVDVVVKGPVHDLTPEAQDEVHGIVREALLNLVNHADAAHARVELICSTDGLRLSVTDDGRGIADDVLRNGGVPGHWGLQGMRDRASRIGGRLTLQRGEQGGTVVHLQIPAALAFRERPRRWLRRITGQAASRRA